ncbi:unnamed protein product [Paramecium primaurelia]|uniref:Transmembrane protein n=1 Tax=Paramecium primaurelia TaxID=5886 RepID=A0A8S1LCV0_PARPR|nr:unnamed protein product [Paramecium primaurelia]
MFWIIKYSLLFLIICGVIIIRDRELIENELEYHKQINYGLWIILIPFLALLLPIFSYKTRTENNGEMLKSSYLNKVEILKQHTNQNYNQDHQVSKKEVFVQTDFGTYYNYVIITQDNKGDLNEGGQDQIQADINQNILTDHFQDNIYYQLEYNQQFLFQQKDKQNNDFVLNSLSYISHNNCYDTERKSITLNSKIFHTYSNSYQMKDLNQTQEKRLESYLQLSNILQIIDAVPFIVQKKYEEFVINNRKERRNLIYKDQNTFTDTDAQNYIELLKILFTFHENLIRKGQKYYIIKNKMNYKNFIKSFNNYLLDPMASNEILSHQRFALQQLKFSLHKCQVLLQYQVLEIYQILINLMNNPNETLNKIFAQFNNQSESVYLYSILQYYLEDYIYYQQKIEDEEFQRYLKIYYNCNEIINLQYNLDERINQYIYQKQRLLNQN